MKKSQLKKLIREVISEAVRGPIINGKEVDKGSIVMDNVDPHDYPDFSDACIIKAEFVDGTELTDEELDLLNSEGELVNNSAHEQFSDHMADRADRARDDVREDAPKSPARMELKTGRLYDFIYEMYQFYGKLGFTFLVCEDQHTKSKSGVILERFGAGVPVAEYRVFKIDMEHLSDMGHFEEHSDPITLKNH
jgi:hypothetical protein